MAAPVSVPAPQRSYANLLKYQASSIIWNFYPLTVALIAHDRGRNPAPPTRHQSSTGVTVRFFADLPIRSKIVGGFLSVC